jgi:hypothetical protein
MSCYLTPSHQLRRLRLQRSQGDEMVKNWLLIDRPKAEANAVPTSFL